MTRFDPAAPVLCAGRRTAIGTSGLAFAGVDVVGLAAPVLAAVADAAAALDRPIDDVVLGNCLGPGGDIARVAALAAGLGDDVPGVTVDRQCGSGLDAVLQAAARVRAGDAELVLAGGAESASTAPWRFWPPAAGGAEPVRYTRAPFAPAGDPDPDMGEAADLLAGKLGISRAEQDRYAARSHRLTHAAATAGRYAAEIVARPELTADQRPRPGLDERRLARLRPAFGTGGTVTAGNSCGVSDGAAALAVTTAGAARAAGLPYLRVLGSAVAAGRPDLPGLAPAPAVRRVLDRTGVAIADVGAVEITEAFASVVLAVVDDLGLDEDRVCTEGGAIGLGHPWGASGTILLLRLLSRLLTPGDPAAGAGSGLGLAACAIGGGQGLAMLLAHPEA
ncbi:thiolase family protein [Nakamurella sp.]|uniref:thiolase family protein n=1 Tax=Nakamurella sp. TaxID=1869182 RepID=UPI003B3A3F1A